MVYNIRIPVDHFNFIDRNVIGTVVNTFICKKLINNPKNGEILKKLITRELDYESTSEEKEKHKINGRYHFISVSSAELLEYLCVIKTKILLREQESINGHCIDSVPLGEKYSFIDLGAGIGNTLFIAKLFFKFNYDNQIKGIEIDKSLIDYGVENLFLERKNFIRKDIMDVDISKKKIIYSYCPFQDMNKQKEFEQKLCEETPVGSYLILPLIRNQNLFVEQNGFRHLYGKAVFEKIY